MTHRELRNHLRNLIVTHYPGLTEYEVTQQLDNHFAEIWQAFDRAWDEAKGQPHRVKSNAAYAASEKVTSDYIRSITND